jgi:hypothetical protein
MAVGVTPGGLEFRTGEYWATAYSELEVTDDPWVADGVALNAAALRESMRVASERQAKLARRASSPKRSAVNDVIAYLGSPGPESFARMSCCESTTGTMTRRWSRG